MKVKAKILAGLLGRTLAVLPLAGFASCNLVREDLPECPEPFVAEFQLRFVYDYNMEFANAFHNQVDCLSAYFFDKDGHLVSVHKILDRELLADENFRLAPQLPVGDYHVIAYGDMDCENASFSNKNLSEGALFSDLHVHLNPDCLIDSTRFRLHNHYYGSADFSVDPQSNMQATVHMMRNTNSIQVALQHLNGSFIDHNDFIYEITDDNNDFDYENNLLATGEIKYNPWNTETRSTGVVSTDGDDDDDNPDDPDNDDIDQNWYAAVAQFTTSRLVAQKQTSTTLHVRRAEDGQTVFRIPLINYMLLFKHDNSGAGLDNMGDQEYLDRENTWNFVFFLKDGLWVDGHIIINDWEVRMNNTDF